ncbi:MAG: NAD(P)H-hydrate dehydratase [Pseudoxanthomonas sp.]
MNADAALYDFAALRAIEAQAESVSGDARQLMRRAGQAAWREVLQYWPAAQRLLVVCGPGNNGGDGYELARHAHQSGRDVRVVRLPSHAPRTQPASAACADYEAAGGRIDVFAGSLEATDLVVDGLFGIGLSRAPDAAAMSVIDSINEQPAPVFALDVPSGIDADRGSAPGAAVVATRTLEFLGSKAGLHTGPALDHVGARALATLDVLPSAHLDRACAEVLQADALANWLHSRARDSHKGCHGRVLCVGGDHGSGGAILLCAQAAARSGAGWTQVATRAVHISALLARLPEAMGDAVDDGAALSLRLGRADVIAIGPGLGQGEWGHDLLATAMAAGKPLVLDADALNLLAARPRTLPAGTILTPHPGEAARLLGISTAEVQGDRFRAARALSGRHGCVVVLKGAGTIVAGPARIPRVIDAGNPGMAVAGMGDVLTGVIAALSAQGLAAFDAASCGALLHAAAGDAAARDGGERGLLPTDLMPWLRRLANPGRGQ